MKPKCLDCRKQLNEQAKYSKIKYCRSCSKKGSRNGMFGNGAVVSKEKNPNWSTIPSYRALHKRIEKDLGKPNLCWDCGTTEAKKYHWANKSKKYKYDLADWIRLCVKCHQEYDSCDKRDIFGRFIKKEFSERVAIYG